MTVVLGFLCVAVVGLFVVLAGMSHALVFSPVVYPPSKSRLAKIGTGLAATGCVGAVISTLVYLVLDLYV